MKREQNANELTRDNQHYLDAGLSQEFIGEMANVIAALRATDNEPYDQLYGYVLLRNPAYITRHGGAREIVSGMKLWDIETFLMCYKNRRGGQA